MMHISKNGSGSWAVSQHPGKGTLEREALSLHTAETPLATMSDITFLQVLQVTKPSPRAQCVFTVRGSLGALGKTYLL